MKDRYMWSKQFDSTLFDYLLLWKGFYKTWGPFACYWLGRELASHSSFSIFV